jgi:transmembrane sensor
MKPSDEHGREAEAIEAEAMAWLAERDEGFAPGRAAAYEAWRHRDARHAASVAELEQVLAQLGGLAERRETVNAHFGRVSPPRPVVAAAPTPLPSLWWWRPVAWGGVAAALAFGFFFGTRAWSARAGPETRYATTNAGYERARLDDGSTLELNTASAARVHFTVAERRVELESGEAHFEVAHDTARPFVVRAGGVAVRAVGTAFNVRFVSGAVEITVTEGQVAVEPAVSAGGSTLVAANQRLAIPLTTAAASAAVIEPLAPAEMRATLAWQRRVADFSDTPLAEVAARFNRHHTLQLVIADPALGARRIGGIFALDDVDAFVRLLERDGIVHAVREGDIVRLQAP